MCAKLNEVITNKEKETMSDQNKNLSDLPLIHYRISLHCPAPTKKRKDKEDILTAEANAERGAYKVQQERIPEKWQKPISATQAKIRKYFDDNCFRLNDTYAIPVEQYTSFEEGYRKLIAQHDVYVQVLCDAIDSGDILEEAKRRMGNDFDPSYLPASCDAVKAAIKVNVSIIANLSSPVIKAALDKLAGDTKVEVEKRVREDMARDEAHGQSKIVGFVMEEVVAFLQDVRDRCQRGAEGTHYKTMLDKFVRVTEKLPSYNVTENPVIQATIAKVYEAFKNLDKDALKSDEVARSDAAESAKSLLEDISNEKLF